MNVVGFISENLPASRARMRHLQIIWDGERLNSEHMHVLPENLKAADIRKIISIVAVRDEFLFELAQEVPNRKRHRRLRSKKVVPEIYTGAQAIFSICEGNPRWLIGLIRSC